MGAIIGIGYAISQVRGETTEEMTASKMRYQSVGDFAGIAANATINNAAVIVPHFQYL